MHLSNDRVYKKAWKLDETLNYIRSEREKTFDPEIVDIFFDSLEDVIRSNRILFQLINTTFLEIKPAGIIPKIT